MNKIFLMDIKYFHNLFNYYYFVFGLSFILNFLFEFSITKYLI